MKKINIFQLVFLFLIFLNVSCQILCQKHCLKCQTAVICKQCTDGYFSNENFLCKPCKEGCQKCLSSTSELSTEPKCIKCFKNFNYDKVRNECFVCDLNCQSCSKTPKNCSSCHEGYQLKELNGQNFCQKISNISDSFCELCETGSNASCILCFSGNYLTWNNKCQICPYPFTSCELGLNVSLVKREVETGFNEINNFFIFLSQYMPQLEDFFTQYQKFQIAKIQNSSVQLNEFLAGRNYTLLGNIVNLNISDQGFSQKLQQFKTHLILVMDENQVKILEEDLMKKYTQFNNSIPMALNSNLQPIFQFISQFKNTFTLKYLLQFLYSQPKFLQIYSKSFDELLTDFPRVELDFTRVPVFGKDCLTGYFIEKSSKTCIHCKPNCFQCTQMECLTCQNGYFLSSSKQCKKCKYPCSECTQNRCISCIPPYKLTSSKNCSLCECPCQKCNQNNISQCLECVQPFSRWPDSTGVCFRCSQQTCEFCSKEDIFNCIVCIDGYSLVNGKCQHCSSNCRDCQISNNTSVCIQCIQRFTLNKISKTCTACGQNCLTCNPQKPQQCVFCQKRAFLSFVDGKCYLCPEFCHECINNQTCTIFKEGFLQSNKKVIHCASGCESCHYKTPEICYTCQKGYILSQTVCKKCGLGCQQCSLSDSDFCTQCRIGFSLKNKKCQKCPQNCLTCLPQNICTSCKRNYVLNGSICVETSSVCGKNCSFCNFQTKKCLICDYGFVLNLHGNCSHCLSHCEYSCETSNPTLCVGCMIGFEEFEGKCVQCQQNCQKCNNKRCIQCFEGFTLSQSNGSLKCKKNCHFPCKRCNRIECTECWQGYNLTNAKCYGLTICGQKGCDYCPFGTFKNSENFCKVCPQNCQVCPSNETCWICNSGFKFVEGKCIQCSQDDSCFNHESSKCPSGNYLQLINIESNTESIEKLTYISECKPCQYPCQECQVYSTYCTSCVNDDYALNGTKCLRKLSLKVQLKFNIGIEKFIQQQQSEKILSNLENKVDALFMITSIQSSSTIIGLSGQPKNETSDMKKLVREVSSLLGKTDFGMQLLSSYIGLSYGNEEIDYKQTEQIDIIGLIIGVSAAGIIIFVVVVIFIYKYRKIFVNFNSISEEASKYIENVMIQEKDQKSELSKIQEKQIQKVLEPINLPTTFDWPIALDDCSSLDYFMNESQTKSEQVILNEKQ